jgi:small subunit ribosomal protein S17
MPENARPRPKIREGVVVSDAMEKTIVVAVRRRVKHGRYHKYLQVSKKYLVHDERNECARGDRVQISESRPLSKRKRWRVRAILDRAVRDAPVLKDETL